jgi:hypothetical protein
VTTHPCGPKAFERTPQRLPHLRSIAERVDHRMDLAPLLRMGAADGGGSLEAQRYFALCADRFFPRGLCPKTSS